MSISNGNAYVEFTYGNSTYTLPYANVTSYDSKPVYADDGYTIIRYEQTVSGTALVADDVASYASLQADLIAAPGRVNSVAMYYNCITFKLPNAQVVCENMRTKMNVVG